MATTALHVRQAAGMSIVDALAARLSRQQLLLVLDNCEHVLDAAAELCAALLTVADDIRILATSREPLGLPEEARFRLPPLTLPDRDAPDRSANGTTWRPAGVITDDMAGVVAVAAVAGPHGYVIVGKQVAPGGSCVADVWWSPDLNRWTRARDVNDTAGSSQVLAVAADDDGFYSAGSHNAQPAVWATDDGRTWTTVLLPLPHGATGVLQQITVQDGRVVALGTQTRDGVTTPLAELSTDDGATWRQVPAIR